MSEKAIGSPAEGASRVAPPAPQQPSPALRNSPRHDDGVTNPRDGRGPLRPRDDQAVKLPLRPPH
jgi:hypothetical protein